MTLSQDILAALEAAQVQRGDALTPKVVAFQKQFAAMDPAGADVLVAFAFWEGNTNILPGLLHRQIQEAVGAYLVKNGPGKMAALYKKLERS